MWGDAGALPECEVVALTTPDNTAFHVHSSGLGRAGIGRSSEKGLSTGRHEKAPVGCPRNRLAALHCALQTLDCKVFVGVKLPQTPEDHLRSARAALGRRTN